MRKKVTTKSNTNTGKIRVFRQGGGKGFGAATWLETRVRAIEANKQAPAGSESVPADTPVTEWERVNSDVSQTPAKDQEEN